MADEKSSRERQAELDAQSAARRAEAAGMPPPEAPAPEAPTEKKSDAKQTAIGCGTIIVILLIVGAIINALVSGEDTPVATLAPDASPEDRIRSAVLGVLEGDTNWDPPQPRHRDTTVMAEEGGFAVVVEFNANDNMTDNLRRSGIDKTMAEVYQALYSDGLQVTEAVVHGYFPLIDRFGNESVDKVASTALDAETAAQVNWQADESTLHLQILPGVWEWIQQHPAIYEG